MHQAKLHRLNSDRYRTLAQEAADALRGAIIRGEISGGQTLCQQQLAKQLGVSRIPVRDALRRLESEGFLHIGNTSGAVVPSVTPDEIRELYDMRGALESQALRLSIPKLLPKDLTHAEKLLRIKKRETDIARWADLNWQFFETLMCQCGRPRLLATVKSLHLNTQRYVHLFLKQATDSDAIIKSQRRLLRHCRARNVPKALAVYAANQKAVIKSTVERYQKLREARLPA